MMNFMIFDKGAMFHCASALTEDCGIKIDMCDLALTRETMDTFVNLHVRVIRNDRGPMYVELIDVFFGQSTSRFLNVSGFPLTNR